MGAHGTSAPERTERKHARKPAERLAPPLTVEGAVLDAGLRPSPGAVEQPSGGRGGGAQEG